jgi:hypothetical protein
MGAKQDEIGQEKSQLNQKESQLNKNKIKRIYFQFYPTIPAKNEKHAIYLILCLITH